MSYCDDCILLDICGNEGCLDDALTFCADKHRFVPVEVIEDIKADIDKEYKWLMATKCSLCDIDIAFDSIKKSIVRHISGKGK